MSSRLPLAQVLLSSLVAFSVSVLPAQQAAAPADGITMEMMPITPDQISSCRSQATGQLTDEQKALHDREHGQDKDKMAQGAITGVTGAATSAISRGRGGYYGWWGNHNNNGAQTAAATGATQRTERNSDNVASTTAVGQQVGTDAYQQCIAGIKGPEYVHFRQTGKIEAFTGSAPAASAAPTPAMTAAAAVAPAAAATPATAKAKVEDTGDGKHFLLTAPGQSDPREVTLVAGSKSSYIEQVTGDKYIVMPDGSVRRIPKAGGAAHK